MVVWTDKVGYTRVTGVLYTLLKHNDVSILVCDLKFVGLLEFKLVVTMPEQLKTTTMHFYEAFRKPYMCLLTPQGNALLWSQFVLGWV